MKSALPVVVGIGEVLWDLLPQGKRLGGAPANVACHAHMLGAEAFPVSCVGKDSYGLQICDHIKKLGMQTDYLIVSERYPTGTVQVEIDSRGIPNYTIHENVAWDYLPWTPVLKQLASETDAVCFGSLAQRGSVTQHTIHTFLASTNDGCLQVFDINLRQDYYTKEVLQTSLAQANVLKLSDAELPVLANLLGLSGSTEELLKNLLLTFDLKLVALTRGAKGSLMVTLQETADCGGTSVEVKDTVGAGDAFAAAMIVGLLRKFPLQTINTVACRLGAFVCSQRGAVPPLPTQLIEELMPPEVKQHGYSGNGSVTIDNQRRYLPPQCIVPTSGRSDSTASTKTNKKPNISLR